MASDETAAKLRTFALILKLGNDLFNAADFMDAAAKAVNDSKILLNFRSAALFESAGKKHRVIAQYGIPEVNPRAKVVLEQQKLLEKAKADENEYLEQAGSLFKKDACHGEGHIERSSRQRSQHEDKESPLQARLLAHKTDDCLPIHPDIEKTKQDEDRRKEAQHINDAVCGKSEAMLCPFAVHEPA